MSDRPDRHAQECRPGCAGKACSCWCHLETVNCAGCGRELVRRPDREARLCTYCTYSAVRAF